MKESKLKPYATTLLEMRDEGKELTDLVAWLKGEGVTAGRSTVGDFVQQLVSQREQARLLDSITSGAAQVKDVEQKFSKNAAPELETLIKLHRVLILQLSTAANANPDLIKLANDSLRTVMEYLSARTKAELEKQKLSIAERRVKLLEDKAKAFDKAKKVSASQLSAEEKEAEYRRIFGMS